MTDDSEGLRWGRYAFVAYETYYPRGGENDFCSFHDDLSDAREAAVAQLKEWRESTARYEPEHFYILNLQTGQTIALDGE